MIVLLLKGFLGAVGENLAKVAAFGVNLFKKKKESVAPFYPEALNEICIYYNIGYNDKATFKKTCDCQGHALMSRLNTF